MRSAIDPSDTSSALSRQSLDVELCAARSLYKRKVRELHRSEESKRDMVLSSFASNPLDVYKSIKINKISSSTSVSKLKVNGSLFDKKSDFS